MKIDETDKYVSEIDDPFMNAFRELLKDYIKTLSTNIVEIAKGLKLSRPVVSDFMSGNRDDLPLTTGKICHLHKILTLEKENSDKNSNNSKKSVKTVYTAAEKARQLLKGKGSDELLIAAGFQPRNMKMVPVSSQLSSQLNFISFLYKDNPLSQDLFLEISEQQLNRRRLSSENKKEGIDFLLEDLTNSWMTQAVIEKIRNKYKKAKENTGRDEITSPEGMGLLTSILHNQLSKIDEIELDLRVVKVEQMPISLTLEKENDQVNKLLEKIRVRNITCESKLTNTINNTNQQKQYADIVFHPVRRTVITCLYDENDKNDKKKIDFEYISTGTHVNAALSAISLNMGFQHSVKTVEMDVKFLGTGTKSLVKAVVILGGNCREELVLGEWVGSDLLQTLLQAMIIAGKRWLFQQIRSDKDTANKYKIFIRKTAELRASLYKYRVNYDGYDFNDSIVSMNEFEKIGENAVKNINELKEIQSDRQAIWTTFLNGFRRIYVISQIYMIHQSIIKLDHNKCEPLLQKINKLFDDSEIKDIRVLIPSKIAFEAEKISYNISFGISWENNSTKESVNLLISDNIIEHLSKIDKKIDALTEEYIKGDDTNYNDPGYDIHYSLGSYHSNVGRLLLYTGETKEHFDEACERFLNAICYFQKIGLSRKVERNLTLAGRVKVRSKKRDYVEQCQRLSKILVDENLGKISALMDKNFELSIQARVNSLKGEYNLIIEGNKRESLICCLQALKGSLWVGLNRHIADNLYTISRCAVDLGNCVITDDLKNIFPELWNSPKLSNLEEADSAHKKLIHKVESNLVARKVIEKLIEISNSPNTLQCWDAVSDDFRELSASIWTDWYRAASKDEKGEHPFAIAIKEHKFLEPI